MVNGNYVGANVGLRFMRRKSWVKVYLSNEQKRLLERIAESLGIGESEVLRQAFMDYAKSISLVTEKVHGKI
jgi:hypothetical protein